MFRSVLLYLFTFSALALPAKDYALFFAVDTYDNMGDLNNPIEHAEAIAKELRESYNFQTEVVSNPTFADIAVKIQEYQQRFASGDFDQKGQLFIFFSGHGVQRGNNGYFLPKDGNLSKLYENVIEYDNWRYEIDQIDCQHILVTIDACSSLTFDPNWRNKTDRNFGRRGDKGKDQVKLDHDSYRARLFFTSNGVNDQTPDNSTLAQQLLKGLRMHRGVNGYLSTDELFAIYLNKAMPAPSGGDFGRDAPGSRFLFFRKQQNISVDTRADLVAWTQTTAENDCAAYRSYLNRFPNGDFVVLARQQAAVCEAEESMLIDWLTAKESNTKGAYATFIAKHAGSSYEEAAKLALQTTTNAYTPKTGSMSPNNPSPANMIFIPGGAFQMGDQFGFLNVDEVPVHTVTVSDFYLSKTELTNREFAEFLSVMGNQEQGGTEWYEIDSTGTGISGSGNSFTPKSGQGDHPVVNVSWYGAVAYCNWLSGQHGYTPVYEVNGTTVTPDWFANGYRLPTEAEWEFAARSGGKDEKWAGTSLKKELVQFANYTAEKDGYSGIAQVGMLRANNLGLADMSGNVSEWCWDWYEGEYYKGSRTNSPDGPEEGSHRVTRGGAWYSFSRHCRVTYRSNTEPTKRFSSVGFRLALGSR